MVGEIVGNYRLEKELGRGTFGTVYRAVHKDMPEITAAVKLVHPTLANDPMFVTSIRRECQILHKLSDPGIVGFKDLIVENGNIGMVLELLDGVDLNDAIHSGRVGKEQAGDVLESILQGLSYAHRKGVVHRDIKPGNIFVCSDGRMKLLDFGISKAAEGTKATKTGTIAGTLDYMPPEAFDGVMGPRLDLYAVGLVAWEIYTGHPACPDSTPMHKMKWHLDIGAPDLWELDMEAPRWLRDLVLQLTNRDPVVRPKDATEALALLIAARGGATPAIGSVKLDNTVTAKKAKSLGDEFDATRSVDGLAEGGGDAAAPKPIPEPKPADTWMEPPSVPKKGGPGMVLSTLVVGVSGVVGLAAGLLFGVFLGGLA